jgi:hypothetical protein
MNTNLKYAAGYGLLSGLIVITILIAGILLQDRFGFLSSVWFGYLVMVGALGFLFFGVKRYRDMACGGNVAFGHAFAMGVAIAMVAAVVYVAGWEIYLATTHYRFMDGYIAASIQSLKDAGVSGAALADEAAKLQEMRAHYGNPLFRLPMTFLEFFPVGLLVALVSALLLRNPRLLSLHAEQPK